MWFSLEWEGVGCSLQPLHMHFCNIFCPTSSVHLSKQCWSNILNQQKKNALKQKDVIASFLLV